MLLTLRSLSLLTLCVLVGACSPEKPLETTESATENLSINDWFDLKYEQELQQSPTSMAFQGRKDRNDEIEAFTYDVFLEQLALKKQTVADLHKLYDYEALTPSEQVSYDLWTYQYEQMVLEEQFFYDGLFFDQMNGVQSFFPTFLINFHKVDNAADVDAYISRIKATELRVNEALAIARKSSALGVTTPGFAIDGVIKQTRAIISGAPFPSAQPSQGSTVDDSIIEDSAIEGSVIEDSALWADIKQEIKTLLEAGNISQTQADSLQAKARTALIENFQPAYQRIIDWSEAQKDKIPAVSSGIGSQPNGAAYYRYRVQNQTSTTMTADEIHQIGLDEVARIRIEMLSIMQDVEFEGDLAAFFEHVRDGKFNYFPDTDEGRLAYIEGATKAIESMKTQLPDFFGILPKADLIVKRVEAFRERDGAAQHYYPGTPDGSRPGIYYAHLSDMTAMPKNQVEAIAYHEGIPGHHMQISIAQELQDMPKFRTQAHSTAYSEGWALYAEVLAREIPGAYPDPYTRFGQMTSEIWRAVRLVVDTGLHTKGWTEQQAIDYFMANSPEPLESVTSEVQRYIVIPAQALSYKIGMMKIMALRQKAEMTLGDKFDIRGFHDTILGSGALPLPLLERQVDRWIATVLAQT